MVNAFRFLLTPDTSGFYRLFTYNLLLNTYNLSSTMEPILFREKQYFRGRHTIPFYVLLLGLILLFAYGIFQQLVLRKPFCDKPATDGLLIAGALLPLSLLLLFHFCFLETQLTREGVYYRWSPFRKKFHFIRWSDLKKAEMLDYGFVGYGWRLTGHGTVYTLGGKTGLHLVKKSGSRLTLGTRQPEKMREALMQVNRE